MKSNQRMFSIIIGMMLIMGFFFILNLGYLSNANSSSYKQTGTISDLRTSGTYENITIDNLPSSSNNWAWAENQVWCSGLGTLENPYIIQGHTLGIDSLADGIEISNSNNIYFIIENCTFFWDGFISTGFEAAITLVNVTKGIINDNIIHGISNGIQLSVCEDIIIANNTVYSTMAAIYIIQSDFIKVSDNTAYSSEIGVGLSLSENNIINNNTVYSNTNGIQVSNSQFNEIYENRANNNNDNGILLWFSDNNTITENVVNDNNDNGIEINNGDNNSVSGNIANDNNIAGIYLAFSDYNSITENTASGSIDGIYLEDDCDNNIISKNAIYSNNIGIEVYYSDFNTIVENNAKNNTYYGISLEGSNNNAITRNQAHNNTQIGICLTDLANNNTISGNTINDNNIYGIYLNQCDNNTISGNIANGNDFVGIHLNVQCDNNSISGNTANNNDHSGIYFDGNDKYNFVSGNIASNNTYTGIHFESTNNDYNTISGNILSDNKYGINIGNSDNNGIYGNFFLTNEIHAMDNGTDNKWNSTTIGNYWDNWTSPDTTPQDGIVDVSYTYIAGTAGSIDHLPIAEDGAPSITINSPSGDDVFGSNAPSYDVTITDDYLFEMWYTLDGGSHNYTFTEFTGIIEQSAWDALSDGTITLTFYASDMPGNIEFADVNIVKDSAGPIIVINSPSSGSEFGVSAPAFIITITDEHLDSMWYSLDGGVTTHDITTNATIDQTAWAALSEGSITISFYANDTLGNEASEDVIITKIIPPSGEDTSIIIVIVVVSIVGGIAVLAFVYIFMKKRATP